MTGEDNKGPSREDTPRWSGSRKSGGLGLKGVTVPLVPEWLGELRYAAPSTPREGWRRFVQLHTAWCRVLGALWTLSLRLDLGRATFQEVWEGLRIGWVDREWGWDAFAVEDPWGALREVVIGLSRLEEADPDPYWRLLAGWLANFIREHQGEDWGEGEPRGFPPDPVQESRLLRVPHQIEEFNIGIAIRYYTMRDRLTRRRQACRYRKHPWWYLDPVHVCQIHGIGFRDRVYREAIYGIEVPYPREWCRTKLPERPPDYVPSWRDLRQGELPFQDPGS